MPLRKVTVELRRPRALPGELPIAVARRRLTVATSTAAGAPAGRGIAQAALEKLARARAESRLNNFSPYTNPEARLIAKEALAAAILFELEASIA